ncbi:MAG: STN domain-containing protein [Opitutaceae bacterium]|nr:STN domain-containing protein [Opitutaceae bacterium]
MAVVYRHETEGVLIDVLHLFQFIFRGGPRLLLIAFYMASNVASALSRDFDIAAGPAEKTLAEFAQHAKEPIVFSTDALRGIVTHGIKGRYSDLEALQRILAGTGIMAVQDAKTRRITLEAVPLNEIVALPPYTVSEAYEEPTWSYAEIGNFKVLSRCSDFVTQMLIEHHVHLRQMLATVLPIELQAQFDAPGTYVLYNEANQPGIAREILDSIEAGEGTGRARRVHGLTNYRFSDGSADVTLCILNEQSFEFSRMSLTADYVNEVMALRMPALPTWFIDGINAIYRATKLESEPLRNPPNYAWGRITAAPISVGPMRWLSDELTKKLQKTPRTKVELSPLDQLFDAAQVANDGPRPWHCAKHKRPCLSVGRLTQMNSPIDANSLSISCSSWPPQKPEKASFKPASV